MVYHAIGIMSGSSLDGMDIVFVALHEQTGNWKYEILYTDCIPYDDVLKNKLQQSIALCAKDYLLLHSAYGTFIGKEVNRFIESNQLHHRVNFVVAHGHTTFHLPALGVAHQLGHGATIAAATKLPVITELRSLDVAFGGQGAPIVPMGEKLLFSSYKYFLNLGGIANVSIHQPEKVIAFDVCPANKVLNMLAAEMGMEYDKDGSESSRGRIHEDLLKKLNDFPYYDRPYPKSLANDFGTDLVFPLIKSFGLKMADALRTYTELICIQITNALNPFKQNISQELLVTGGGAFNSFLIKILQEKLRSINFEIIIPDDETIKFKEALIMALLGALRWREQYTILSSVTGAEQSSIGGALWLGTEA